MPISENSPAEPATEGRRTPAGVGPPAPPPSPLPAAAVTLADAMRAHILAALHETRWVVGGPNGAAARLGLKRSTLQKKMQKLGITRPD
jgi:formate hydrogenlyase transcriptional activator